MDQPPSFSACSEETNSICDEEKIRQLFQVCDNDGDGFIDSQDLATICQELKLDYCLEDLMQELGADQTGKISYNEFLQKRLALKPEIDALKKKKLPSTEYLLTGSSDMSLGVGSLGKQNECWEFDSGARDLSPEPNTLQRLVEVAGRSSLATSSSGNLLQLANKLHLAALSSLRTEILDLNTRLQNVTEERDMYQKALEKSQNAMENITQDQYEEQITELHCVIAELTRKLDQQRNLVIAEEDELTESQSVISHSLIVEGEKVVDDDMVTENGEDDNDDVLNVPDVGDLEINVINSNLKTENCNCNQLREENESLKHRVDKLMQKVRGLEDQIKVNQESTSLEHDQPVLKRAEKVAIKKLKNHITGAELMTHGVSNTKVAEQLVSNVQGECDFQELSRFDGRYLEIETEKLNSKLEHVKIQNTLLQATIDEMKSYCERLTVLMGKYESNAIALELVLSITEKIVENYQLICESNEMTKDNEELVRNIKKLEREKSKIEKTIVKLESYHHELEPSVKNASGAESRKMDLEMAVLMQELLSMREDKAELRAKIYDLEHDKDVLEMKLNSMQCEQMTFNEQDDKSVENKLKQKLKQMSQTLDRVNRTYELRQIQSEQLTNELKMVNTSLVNSFEKCKKKSQSRLKRLENEIVIMAERHSAQVQLLKQRISSLEDHLARNSKEKS